jgi:phage tail sheath protein FI
MPEFLPPGVYIEEVAFGAHSIEGVSTSTTGFIGAAESPRLLSGLTSLGDFERQAAASSSSVYLSSSRTTSTDPDWKYVNGRRFLIFIEQSLKRGLQWVVFEPNGVALWEIVRRSIDVFLLDLWKSGALMGQTADEAYFVRCDRATMTQDDIDNGRLIAVVGVAPLRPAEFVILRITCLLERAAGTSAG